MSGKTTGPNEERNRLEAARRSSIPMKRFSVLVLGVAGICTVLAGEDVGLDLLGTMPS